MALPRSPPLALHLCIAPFILVDLLRSGEHPREEVFFQLWKHQTSSIFLIFFTSMYKVDFLLQSVQLPRVLANTPCPGFLLFEGLDSEH